MPLINENFPTAFQLAIEHYRAGNYAESKAILEQITPLQPPDHATEHLRALCEYRLGNLSAARDAIQLALELRSDDSASWNVLGEISRHTNDQAKAREAFLKAIALDPNSLEAHNNLGVLCEAVGELEKAEHSYRTAIAIDNTHALSWFNLANTLVKSEKDTEARQAYETALQLAPNYTEALNNYGALLTKLRCMKEALEIFDGLYALRPHFYDGIINYAETLRQVGRLQDALALLDKARSIASPQQLPETLTKIGSIAREMGKRAEARAVLREAYNLNPSDMETIQTLINAELDCGNFKTAKSLTALLLERDPNNLSVRLCLTMLQLPVLYDTESEIVEARSAYSQMLQDIEQRFAQASGRDLRVIEDIVGNNQPFFLPYQGHDCVELQKRYGVMVCDAMGRAVEPLPLKKVIRSRHERIRLGVVSGFFRNHSNYKLPIRGWLTALDRSRFDIFGYHTQSRIDEFTKEASSLCISFKQGPLPFRSWIEDIVRDELDVLLYPEIGMDPTSCKLASLRLAPVQATSWGHPVTSGFPTIDYFLSSDAMEPSDGDAHYTETLVRLPKLSILYRPTTSNDISLSRKDIPLREDSIAYWCCQSNYKYLPQYDWILPEIASQNPNAQFLFITIQPESEAAAVFKSRIRRAFSIRSLAMEDYVVFLPGLSFDQFAKVSSLCDVCLDSISWSGCNSSLEVLAQGVPIITWPGTFMRARHTEAILKTLECDELITHSADEYIERAVTLGRDPERRARLSSHIRNRISRLYNDDACVRALEQALESWVAVS